MDDLRGKGRPGRVGEGRQREREGGGEEGEAIWHGIGNGGRGDNPRKCVVLYGENGNSSRSLLFDRGSPISPLFPHESLRHFRGALRLPLEREWKCSARMSWFTNPQTW